MSYPQYVHLMGLRKKVLKLDAAMKKISLGHDKEVLKNNRTWNKLVKMRNSLLKLIPEELAIEEE